MEVDLTIIEEIEAGNSRRKTFQTNSQLRGEREEGQIHLG